MEIAIGIVIGCVLTALAAFFLIRRERQLNNKMADDYKSQLQTLDANYQAQIQKMTADLDAERTSRNALQADKETWITDRATLLAENKAAQETIKMMGEQAQRDEQQRQKNFQNELNLAREAMRAQFEKEMLDRTDTLKKANSEQMALVVEPLRRELDQLRQLLNITKESSDKNTASLAQSIKDVFEHDKERDKTTQTLAAALKNKGKIQGDWGEQVLTNILNDSGLRLGHEYFVQDNVKDEEGRNLRPDVIVKGADGSRVIIDSKVSLTAYSDYVGAETDEERKAADKANYDSIWKHVEELAAKKYNTLVGDAVPIVLMFVPNEGSYILAMNHDAQLGTKAYQKGVLIINPTNLMVVLKLIFLTWQNTRQEKNYEAIKQLAAGVYEKYSIFAESYVQIGSHLNALQNTYEKSIGQLRDGKGNLSSRIEKLRMYGVTTTKSIPEKVQSLDDDDPQLALE